MNPKRLQTFHDLAAPYFNTVDAAETDSHWNGRRPTPECHEITGIGEQLGGK